MNRPATEGQPDGEEKNKLVPRILLYVLAVAVLFVWSATKFHALVQGSEEPESSWTLLLLALPAVMSLGNCYLLWERGKKHEDNIRFCHFFLTAMGVCVVSNCAFLYLYSTGFKGHEVISFLALLLILVILFLVGVMTYAFIGKPDKKMPERLSEALRIGVREDPLLAISTFIVMFLSVAFLFGFSFAFHDQAKRRETTNQQSPKGIPALHMLNLLTPDYQAGNRAQSQSSPTPTPGPTASPTPAAANGQSTQVADGDIAPADDFYFFFNSDSAYLGTVTPEGGCSMSQCGENQAALSELRHAWDGKSRPELKTGQYNFCQLEAIKERVRCKTQNGSRVRIELVGHSDNEQTKRYNSNYDLSAARTENVRFQIMSGLRGSDSTGWHNIEWLALPSSSEEFYRDSKMSENLGEIIQELTGPPRSEANIQIKRVVRASIVPLPKHITTQQMQQMKQPPQEQSRPLRLMDYMYFSIYTITTTGYGDIVPTTAYAKFVCSLANICEVLFLVVFFNALISLKGDPPLTHPEGTATIAPAAHAGNAGQGGSAVPITRAKNSGG